MSEQINHKYGLFASASMVIGICIGIGIFFRTSELLIITKGHVLIALAAWVAGGILSLLGGLSMAELAGTVKESGGDISYAKAAVGEKFAYVLGWGSVFLSNPSINAILVWVGSGFTCQLLGVSMETYQLPLAIIFLISFFALNILRPVFSGRLQGILTLIKLIPLFAIAFIGLMTEAEGVTGIHQALPSFTAQGSVAAFFGALIPVAFTFDGWLMVATISGEIRHAEKNLPLALGGGLFFVTLMYILIYFGFINVFPVATLMEPGVVPFGVANKLFGPAGGRIIMAGIVISALGAFNGYTMGAMRRPYSLAIKGLFPFASFFGKVNKKLDVPLNSSLLTFFMTFIFIIINHYGSDFSSIGSVLALLSYIFIYTGIIKMHYKGQLNKEGYHTPLFPLIPLLAIIGWTMVAIGIFLIDRKTTINVLIALSLYLTGLPVYWLMKKKAIKGQLIK